MRKIISLLFVFTVLFSAAAFADDMEQSRPTCEPETGKPVPPIEEYSKKAWPITAESYIDLLENTDARFGQVYMVEGAVHEVLSQNPLRIIIHTGEDGESQPVVIECPEQLSFKWEEGDHCRIYADVSSICDGLPVLTARYTFYILPEDG